MNTSLESQGCRSRLLKSKILELDLVDRLVCHPTTKPQVYRFMMSCFEREEIPSTLENSNSLSPARHPVLGPLTFKERFSESTS